ncbi:MAG: starch-binding protein [Bacteroidota bacterium]|nr:starch-binding protein [Bacteroidota bacterium]
MKKILSIISAGLLVVLAASCNKDEKATFDPSDVTAPVLGTVNVGSDIVVNYTPAVFSMDFNQKMKTYHTLGMVAVNDEKCDVTLSNAKDSGTSIKLSGKNLTAALQLRGFEMGESVKVAIVVRASIQDPSKGVTNGYTDSEDSFEFNWTLKEESKPGSLPTHDGVRIYIDNQTGWDAIALYMWGDVNDFGGGWPGMAVAGNITLGGIDWTYFDYTDEIFGLAEHLIFNNNGGGTQLADYDITFEAGVVDYWLTVTADGVEAAEAPSTGTVDPYAGWEATEEWSVIGSIASTGSNWGQDEPMLTDGTWFVCRGIELTTTDQFKFRKDHDWGTNFGAASSITEEPYVVTLGEELEAGAGGKNLAVPADGKYDLLLNPEAGVYKVIEAQEAVAADFYAGFEETEVWSVIGSITSTGNNWGQDEPMLTDGTWYVCKGIELVTADQFKFRKDHDWGTNFGAGPEISEEPYIAALGEELPAGPGGKNLGVAEDGTYDLLLNPDAAVYKIIKSGDDPQL